MQLWQTAMPRGMLLKSQGFASNLSSPDGQHTLEAFCAATGRPYASYGLPVPLATFVEYGQWFRGELLSDLEETLVTEVVPKGGQFEIGLANGDRARARNAALLHESGADVQLAARKPEIIWNGPPLPPDRPLIRRLREPEAGLSSGWSTWFYSRHPELFRHLPRDTRVHRARTALGPAGASWLPSRVNGQFPVLVEHALRWAKADGDGVVLGFEQPGGASRELTADHVIAATGYRSDLGRLTFLSDQLRPALRTVADTAVVDRWYHSSVPGLYFIGPAVAPTFGPVMRFVYGSDHAARTVARRLAG